MSDLNRRDFLSATALAAAAFTQNSAAAEPEGWFHRPIRWAQLTLVEDDPGKYDPAFWLDYFQRTHCDAACLSAGGDRDRSRRVGCDRLAPENSMTVYLVNLTNPMMMKGPLREFIPTPPRQAAVLLPVESRAKRVRLLVSGSHPNVTRNHWSSQPDYRSHPRSRSRSDRLGGRPILAAAAF